MMIFGSPYGLPVGPWFLDLTDAHSFRQFGSRFLHSDNPQTLASREDC